MRKKERQRLLRRLLKERIVRRQEDFVTMLLEMDVEVTQATISRDIKDMKLVKVPIADGGYRYSLPAENSDNIAEKMDSRLKEAILSVDWMDKYVTVKTLPGNAPASASLIERHYQNELFTLLHGDDRILMIFRTEELAEDIADTFSRYLSE